MAEEQVELLRQIKRSLDVLIRLRVQDLCAGRSQKEMILLLDSVGCRPSEIAGLLGTTANSVSPVLSRARRRPE